MPPLLNLCVADENSSDPDISGLQYIPNYITAAEQGSLIARIDKEPWRNDLKRRVQHYGYRYDYRVREIDKDAYLSPLPLWLTQLCEKLKTDQIFSTALDQVIANEYEPGQGISAHVDCVPCFGGTIASLSLGSGCMMEFTNSETGVRKSIFLEPCSLIILSGEARYQWQHAIPARKSDIIGGIKTPRSRRISLTFRNVILNA